MSGVVLVNVTANPEVVVALNVAVPPAMPLAGGVKVIVWLPLVMTLLLVARTSVPVA
jgi:hypothetical protein